MLPTMMENSPGEAIVSPTLADARSERLALRPAIMPATKLPARVRATTALRKTNRHVPSVFVVPVNRRPADRLPSNSYPVSPFPAVPCLLVGQVTSGFPYYRRCLLP